MCPRNGLAYHVCVECHVTRLALSSRHSLGLVVTSLAWPCRHVTRLAFSFVKCGFSLAALCWCHLLCLIEHRAKHSFLTPSGTTAGASWHLDHVAPQHHALTQSGSHAHISACAMPSRARACVDASPSGRMPGEEALGQAVCAPRTPPGLRGAHVLAPSLQAPRHSSPRFYHSFRQAYAPRVRGLAGSDEAAGQEEMDEGPPARGAPPHLVQRLPHAQQRHGMNFVVII
jgi:hypothetical protein